MTLKSLSTKAIPASFTEKEILLLKHKTDAPTLSQLILAEELKITIINESGSAEGAKEA
jgi:hypothetical protein